MSFQKYEISLNYENCAPFKYMVEETLNVDLKDMHQYSVPVFDISSYYIHGLYPVFL